jgi:uncharacterized membrane protein
MSGDELQSLTAKLETITERLDGQDVILSEVHSYVQRKTKEEYDQKIIDDNNQRFKTLKDAAEEAKQKTREKYYPWLLAVIMSPIITGLLSWLYGIGDWFFQLITHK